MDFDSSAWYWTLAAILALVDAVFLLALARAIPRATFRGLRWPLALAVASCWSVLWASVWWSSAWHTSYGLLFPSWVRWLGPFLYAFVYVLLSFVFFRVALFLPGRPVVAYCLLGGLTSIPSNLMLIYGLDMLTRVPMMRAVSVAATMVEGCAEFVLYWCIFASISLLVRRGIERLLGRI
jgi:hypothetical protein